MKLSKRLVCAVVGLGLLAAPCFADVPALLRQLKDRDSLARERAAEALGRTGTQDPRVLPALIRALADPDPYVDGKVAQALSRLSKAAVPSLAKALRDRSLNVRSNAAVALGKLGPEAAAAAPELLETLQDGEATLRWYSAVALGNAGGSSSAVVAGLARALTDPDEDVRWGAGAALEKLDPETLRRTRAWSATAVLVDTSTPVLMKELHMPGVSVALIWDRQLVWSKQYGLASARRRAPVTAATRFEACSMSKPVFAYLAMKLVEQGKLDLDRPLADYLPEPYLPEEPEHKLITARMALAHTTGFPDWRPGDEERGGPIPILFKPGSRFEYSGEGFLFLQRAVEAITGEPLETYIARTLLEPLGMRRSSYVWTPELEADLADGHEEDGSFLRKTKYLHASSAYSLYTTAEDYARFLLEMLKLDRSAPGSLSRRSLDEMLKRQVEVTTRKPVERPGAAAGRGVYRGLGWAIDDTPAGDIVYHSGSNRSGFRCYCQFNPGNGSGLVIMTNGGSYFWRRLVQQIGDF